MANKRLKFSGSSWKPLLLLGVTIAAVLLFLFVTGFVSFESPEQIGARVSHKFLDQNLLEEVIENPNAIFELSVKCGEIDANKMQTYEAVLDSFGQVVNRGNCRFTVTATGLNALKISDLSETESISNEFVTIIIDD